LRAARARVDGDPGLRGTGYGRALANALDASFHEVAEHLDLPGRFAVVGLGSYARRELCPGSDVDVMLLHDGRGRGPTVAAAADELWYPLWDAGFVLGHAVRTPKEALALAASEIDALTGLIELRPVTGDVSFAKETLDKARRLARKRRGMVIGTLAGAAAGRAARPGPIAEMLEPNLKDGAGGLRDLQALEWVGIATGTTTSFDPGAGLAVLIDDGYLQPGDPTTLDEARTQLLETRVVLHRVTGGSGDVLLLQEQDQVAAELGVRDADALMGDLARATRAVTWIASDVWRRQRDSRRGPLGRRGSRDRDVAAGVVVRDGAVTLTADATMDAATVLHAANAAAGLAIPISRASLERMRAPAPVVWDDDLRDAFVGLLRAGRGAVPVCEALDQVGVITALLPEWERVQGKPQRNAYHRFTVDRHLLECVAECVVVLESEGFDGDIARRARPDLLLFGALLHDIGKGLPGDHSETGADTARVLGQRIGLDEHGVEVLAWLVREHLLLAETATRRDLSDESTIVRFGRAVRDTERLDLLYALTIGDSRATGPAAWSSSKAMLLRQLFLETDALLELGVVGRDHAGERNAIIERHRELLAGGELALAWSTRDDGLVECAVAAPDHPGLLATVAGVLALHGFDIRGADVYGTPEGMALEVYRGVDTFERLDVDGQARVRSDLQGALDGTLSLTERLNERFQRYRQSAANREVRVAFDVEASSAATVVEVEAPDEVGLLARVAAVFTDLGFDVTAALVSTLGDRVVDVFYVRDVHGAKPTDPLTLDRLRATLIARLTAAALA
jgi:[protein-PII] uridylyltransferase